MFISTPIARAIGLASLGFSSTALAQTSGPRVIADLRLHETGGKEITVNSLGETVLMDLYVSVIGGDADPTNEGLQSNSGSFTSSSGGLLGDLLGLAPVAPFNGSGTRTGVPNDYDLDGDLDVTMGDGDIEQFYFSRSNTRQWVTPPGGFYVGRVRFTVTSFAGESTAVNWAGRTDIGSNGTTYYAAGVTLDGVNFDLRGNDSRYSVGAPVIIRTGTVVDPGPTQFLSGTINDHVTISGSVKPQAGSTLTFARGVDVTATGHFDSRNASGQFGAHQAFVRDATSGNAGGAFIIGNVTVGAAETATLNHTGGFTNIGTKLVVGDAAGSHGRVNVSGGNFTAAAADVGGAGDGTIRQTGGAANFTNLLLGTGSGQGRYELAAGELFVAREAVISEGGSGVFRQTGGTGSIGNRLVVGGKANATAGTLEIAGGTLTAGFVNVGFTGSGDVAQTGGSVATSRLAIGGENYFGPQSRYAIDAGRVDASAMVINSGSFVQNGGDVVSGSSMFISTTTGNVSRYELHGGTLRSAAVNVVWANNGDEAPTGLTGLFVQDGGAHVADRVLIRTGGTYRHTGGAFIVKKQLSNRGTLDFGNAAVTFNADRDAFIDLQRGTLTGESNANFRGAAGSLFSFPAGYEPLAQLGSIQTEGLIHVAGQPLSIPAGYSVSGSGTIAGTVTNAGSVNPGNSPGVLGVDGSYTQTGSGALRVEIAGGDFEDFDRLTVTGASALGGTLDVALLGDFIPDPSQSFTILTAGALSGVFSNAIDQVAFAGGVFDVAYGPTSVTLSNFAAVPEPTSLALLVLAPLVLARRRR